jgi:hypothetical protein
MGHAYDIKILNSMSQVLKEEKLSEKINQSCKVIDLSDFAPGIYYLSVTGHEGKEVRKIILEK